MSGADKMKSRGRSLAEPGSVLGRAGVIERRKLEVGLVSSAWLYHQGFDRPEWMDIVFVEHQLSILLL